MNKPLSWNAEGERLLNEWREFDYPPDGEIRIRVMEWAQEKRGHIDDETIRILKQHPKLWKTR